MKKKRHWVGYLVTVLIAVAMAAGVFISRGGLMLTAPADILGALCDGFFVPGIVLTSLGVLVLVANEVFFDIMSYGLHSFLVLFTPLRKAEKHAHYFDYKMARAARRKKPRNVLLWVGLAFVAAAGVCLAGYALVS